MLEKTQIKNLINEYPYIEEFFQSFSFEIENKNKTLKECNDEFKELGIEENIFIQNLREFIENIEKLKQSKKEEIQKIKIIRGKNKKGELEKFDLEFKKGEVIAIIGPTGSGKSRLLADIEYLAQNDSPTNRKILINDKEISREKRFSLTNKLVAQISQNMNFVIDLNVREFLELHAESRFIKDYDELIEEIIKLANELSGEEFDENIPVSSLSGGQSRALMIADLSILSFSPIVLIDEIENAGIDRRKAIDLLVRKEKIVFLSTHDPILALMADKRIVIKNGGIEKILISTDKEKENLLLIEKLDNKLLEIRNKLRNGDIIDSI